MRWLLMLCLAGCSTKSVRPEAQGPRRALLTGRAVLSANTFVDGPHSGSCVEGGPFSSQPVQGFSSLQLTPNGFLSISDNGYGVPETSADFLLRAWKLEPDLTTGVLKATTLFVLSDPSRRLPWPIVNENTTTRLLTGADLDPESFVRVADGTFWFGDEHGPFLVHVDDQGRVLEPPFEVPIDGGVLLGADSPFLRSNLMLRSAEALRLATGTRTISPDHRWLTSPEQVKALHTAGFRVVPWTVNEPASLDELLRWNVDGIITDRPDLGAAVRDAGKALHGHRGARGLAPEETPLAFALGLDAGATVLELDLTATADDEAIVWHDPSLSAPKCPRAPDAGLLIPATKLEVLRRIDCNGLLPEFPFQRRDGGSTHTMTLTEALKLPGRLNIETKLHGTGQPHDDPSWLTRLLIKRVQEADAGARVTLQSFDWRSLQIAHAEAPWLETIALFGDRTVRAPPETRLGFSWPERVAPITVHRSSGFENLAVTADGSALIAMLEKPLPGESDCLAFRFDLRTKRWAGVAFRFPLDERAKAVGDLTLVNERFGYALERDDTERRSDGFKRLVRFTLPDVVGATVTKTIAADLLDLALPDGGTFTFPFWTIEGVTTLPDGRVVIVNDNNFPFGRGRSETSPDESELIVVQPR